MNKIQLLYVENIISRKHKVPQQKLTFFMQVQNTGYDKQCEVIWAGEDGKWITLSATYHSRLDANIEYWQAEVTLKRTVDQSLPGNIVFVLKHVYQGQAYWDNNAGLNYVSQADSGLNVIFTQPIQHIGFSNQSLRQETEFPITVSVPHSLTPQTVIIHWTIDDWVHTYQTPCLFNRAYWDDQYRSNARNPNQYGVEVWQGLLKVDHAFRVQYSVSCDVNGETYWDNNKGQNYSLSHDALKVLILNLHCYQEEQQDEKFSQIAKAINEQQPDVVCLQEVAELWNNGQGDWETNSAKIINDRLSQPYHLFTDWSHIGFDKYREGVAILSRYPFLKQQSKYVSSNHSPYSIHSRKVVMAQVEVPCIGIVNVYSAHLSWWDDGFSEQFNCLSEWASEYDTQEVKATLLCGDFNITAGSEGYNLVVNDNKYDDQFLKINDQGVFDKIFRVNDSHWQHYLADDYRIDYIFMSKSSELQITHGNVLFTDQDYGRVSDHCGYLMTFEPK